MRLTAGLALVAALVVAGCMQGDDGDGGDTAGDAGPGDPSCPTPPTTTGAEPGATPIVPRSWQDGFEPADQAINGISPSPRKVLDGTWTVEPDGAAYAGANVMFGQGDADPGFSMLLFPIAGEPSDVAIEVAFRIGCVEHPHGVGVVLHVADGGDDYQIVRYSASEDSWDLFTVRGGERIKHDAAWVGDGTDPSPGEWTLLRVTSTAGRVQAYDGETMVLDFQLEAADASSGQVGLFLRGGSDAAFDAVAIDVPAPA